jgi:outer membrane protein
MLNKQRLTAVLFFLGFAICCVQAQKAPPSPDRPWESAPEQRIQTGSEHERKPELSIDLNRIYTLAELIDFAEQHNPETRAAWQAAKAQAAAAGVARSALFPTLAVAALGQTTRQGVLFGSSFVVQTLGIFEPLARLDYTIFDFGARQSRIASSRAELSGANFAFNDTHRTIIYEVARNYYQLLNATGQQDAAQANLSNAQTVQQASEDRLAQGLATLPDVLEARSATAQAQYDLQSVTGAQDIARGSLSSLLGLEPTVALRVQPIEELHTPDTINDSVEDAIHRAMQQRPDLMERVARIRAAEAELKQARSAFYPTLSFTGQDAWLRAFGEQDPLAATYAKGQVWDARLSLNWTVFDGGQRRNAVIRAEANKQRAQAQTDAMRDQIADEVWRSYTNAQTALRQQQAAAALLRASTESYQAALQAYNYGVRSLLDVSAAQRALARARTSDISARVQLLFQLADLSFRTGDLARARTVRPGP